MRSLFWGVPIQSGGFNLSFTPLAVLYSIRFPSPFCELLSLPVSFGSALPISSVSQNALESVSTDYASTSNRPDFDGYSPLPCACTSESIQILPTHSHHPSAGQTVPCNGRDSVFARLYTMLAFLFDVLFFQVLFPVLYLDSAISSRNTCSPTSYHDRN